MKWNAPNKHNIALVFCESRLSVLLKFSDLEHIISGMGFKKQRCITAISIAIGEIFVSFHSFYLVYENNSKLKLKEKFQNSETLIKVNYI